MAARRPPPRNAAGFMVHYLAGQHGASHDEVVAWLSHPVVTVLTVLLVFSLYYHAKLGLQVVIEDYISGEGVKLVTLTA